MSIEFDFSLFATLTLARLAWWRCAPNLRPNILRERGSSVDAHLRWHSSGWAARYERPPSEYLPKVGAQARPSKFLEREISSTCFYRFPTYLRRCFSMYASDPYRGMKSLRFPHVADCFCGICSDICVRSCW